MRTAAKLLKFPLAGIATDIAYREATTPDERQAFAAPFAINVRGDGTFEGRSRGGSRPGLKRLEVSEEEFETAHATTYRDRAMTFDGIVWSVSSIGDHSDFSFGDDSEDPSKSVAGTLDLAGVKGDEITAMMPVLDRYLFIATLHSLWVVTGDPQNGMKCVSDRVGCIGEKAWCFDGQRIWFVSNQGIYAYSVLGGEVPQKVSVRVPEEFEGLDDAVVIHDPEAGGVHVFGEIGGEPSDWFFDAEHSAFWKQQFAIVHRPVEVGYVDRFGVHIPVFKGTDGEFRYFDNSQDDDDGVPFGSIVAIGPIRVSQRDDMDGIVGEMSVTTAKGSDEVVVSVYTAHSPEEAVSLARDKVASPFIMTASEGWNRKRHPRVRGAWSVFTVSSAGRWAYESITAVMKMTGTLR